MIMNPFFKKKKIIASHLPKNILDLLLKSRTNYHLYQNINYNPTSSSQKHILISYITSPMENDVSKFITHTNIMECLVILKTFIDLEFNIDLVHCLDTENLQIIEKKKYHMIFGFGESFYRASLKNPNATKIVYLTESHPDFFLKKEKERIDYFYERNKRMVILKRSCLYLRTKDIAVAEYGILLGMRSSPQKRIRFPLENYLP